MRNLHAAYLQRRIDFRIPMQPRPQDGLRRTNLYIGIVEDAEKLGGLPTAH